VRQSRGQVARVASEHAGGVDDGRLTVTTGQRLDDDVLQVRIAVFAVVFPPERCVGKVIDWEAWEAVVPSRGQRAGVSLHSLFLGGKCNDVPVPELVEEARQGFHCQFTLNVCHTALHTPNKAVWKLRGLSRFTLPTLFLAPLSVQRSLDTRLRCASARQAGFKN